MLGIVLPAVRAEALKGHVDSMVLAVLADGPLHGYAVIEELKRRSGGQLALPEGTIYPVLHRLERASLLRSSWAESPRRRRVYDLTAKGRRELGERRREWSAFAGVMEAVLAS